VWSAPRSGRFTPEKDPVPIVQDAGWAPRPVWTCAKNLVPTGIFLNIFVRIWCFIVLVLDFQCSFVSYRTACCGGKIRRLRSGANPLSWVPEARMQTPRPPKPLFDPRTIQPVVSRYTDLATRLIPVVLLPIRY
jgi:hypothetical protein